MNWITATELALIHARVIEETGGAQGIINPGGVEYFWAIARGEKSIEDIAAWLAASIETWAER